MRLNENQREGVAKVADNLATANMVAAVVGGLVDRKIGWPTVSVLAILCVVLICIGIVLRRKGDENGS